MEIAGIRGAILAGDNTAAAIHDAAARLVEEVMSRNDLGASDIISMFFTMTPDLNAAFPATAARKICGLDVPLLCATEVGVPGSPEKVIRVLVHAYYPRGRGKVKHTYLDGAQVLRPDIGMDGGTQK